MLYGATDIRRTSEQLFYLLDQQARGLPKREVKTDCLGLYFSFDKNDTIRNSLRDMLATLICQCICHQPDRLGAPSYRMFTQLSSEHGWTGQDLIQWFQSLCGYLHKYNAYLVIDSFEDCPQDQRKAFLDWLSLTFKSSENLWKVAITSHMPGLLFDELSLWKSIDLASTIYRDLEAAWCDQDSATEHKSQSSRHRLELLDSDSLLHSLGTMSGTDVLIRDILLTQAMPWSPWPENTSVADVYDLNGTESDGRVAKLLQTILNRLPPTHRVDLLLTWLLYTARPLSIWEFTLVIYPYAWDESSAILTAVVLRSLTRWCEDSLSGVVEIRDGLVQLRHPRMRKILARPGSTEGSRHVWDEVDAGEAAHIITKTCLDFLGQPNIQRIMVKIAEGTTTLGGATNCPVPDPRTFCSYAVYYWPRHYSSIPAKLNPESLLEEYRQSATTSSWAKAYWVLDNPVTRPKQPWESADALFVTLGLPIQPTFKKWDSHSIKSTICGAASRGQYEKVERLLPYCDQSRSALMDVLAAATASGQEKLALRVFAHVKETLQNDAVKFN